jgi:hypothetical protein
VKMSPAVCYFQSRFLEGGAMITGFQKLLKF